MSYLPTIERGAADRPLKGARPAEGRDLIEFLSGGAARDAADFPASTADVFDLDNLRLTLDRTQRILWWAMRPVRRPSFTAELLADMKLVIDALDAVFAQPSEDEPAVNHLVLSSLMPGIFNLGGDLSLFLDLIERRDRAGLIRYAHHCADGQHRIASNFGLPISTTALIQGDALGGGFEAALSCDVIVAERQAKFGLPEILFNLFPGMGAYSFLSRRLGAKAAEKIIMSGRIYTAEEFHDMGVVDVLCEEGEGPASVRGYVTRHGRRHMAEQAVYKVGRRVQPITYDELRDVTEIWVATALRLTEADLRKMSRITAAQGRRWVGRRDDAIPA